MPNLDLRPPALNLLTYYKGDYTIRFEFTQDASVYPLTDVTAASFIIYEKNGTPALSLSSGSGLTINGAGGYIDLALTNAQVVALYSQEYNFEFLLTLTGGTVWPIADGVFIVSEDGQTSVSLSDISLSVENSTVEISVIAPAMDLTPGHEIQDEGTPLTQRGALNFVGAGVTVTDDSGNDRTTVTISGGGGGGTWGSITGTLSDQTDLQTALDGKVDENAAITGATKTKITYDAKGLVTAGADATTADINDSTDRRYVTDAQQTVIGNTSGTNTGDQTITLTGDVTGSGTGSFAATIAADAVTNTKAANMAAWTVKGRNNAASGDPQDIGVADLTEEGSPAAGDMLFGWESGGALRKFDIGNLPGGGGGASYESITSGELQTLIDADGLTPGGWYLITDANGTDLGFLTYAVTENQISVAGVGGYLNADFQAVGNYDGVEAITGIAAGTRQGIWRTSFEVLTINYTNLAGGTFAVGDTITGGTTGATAVITSDDGVSALMAYMTSAGVAFDGSEVLDNGGGVTADMTAIELGPTIALGDIVIWNLIHWQLTDDTVLDGTDPATNTAAYTQLLKTDAGQGYITAWDVSEFDFANNNVVYRQDSRGGLVRGATGVEGYQFGRDDCAGNNIQSPDTFDIRNLVASFNNNTMFPGAIVSDIITGADTAIENNILENGAYVTGITAGANCSISNNSIGSGSSISNVTFLNDSVIQNSVLAGGGFMDNLTANDNDIGLSGNVLTGGQIADIIFSASGTRIEKNIITMGRIVELTLGGNVSLSQNTLAPDAVIESLILGAGTVVENNIIQNGGSLNGIETGENCSISRNKIGQGATLGGTTTMGDGARLDRLSIAPNILVTSLAINDGHIEDCLFNGPVNDIIINNGRFIRDTVLFWGNNTLQQLSFDSGGIEDAMFIGDGRINNRSDFYIEAVVIETRIDNTATGFYPGTVARKGFSDFTAEIDIEGLTALILTDESQYVGIYVLTSGNATEAIDQIDNPPTAFPFTIRPAAGLTLTITGTAYSGIAAGQIALKAASYVLDGSKGEYIVLEIDPLGSGALIEKYVVNGLI